jgi:hypothetical protein
VARALEEGTELAKYDARLVRARIAMARADTNATEIVREALSLAEAGGHLLSAAKLRELAALDRFQGGPPTGRRLRPGS